jgi:hypothetical protein
MNHSKQVIADKEIAKENEDVYKRKLRNNPHLYLSVSKELIDELTSNDKYKNYSKKFLDLILNPSCAVNDENSNGLKVFGWLVELKLAKSDIRPWGLRIGDTVFLNKIGDHNTIDRLKDAFNPLQFKPEEVERCNFKELEVNFLSLQKK